MSDQKEKIPVWAGEMKKELEAMACRLTAELTGWHGPDNVFYPEDFGDCTGKATEAIQGAIDAAANGGGTVLLRNPLYTSGTLVLRSNVRLELAEGCVLHASTDLCDYPDHVAKRRTVMDTNMGQNQSLIFAEGCENIAISGKGTIDGHGAAFVGEETQKGTPGRPFLMRILDCNDVHVSGIILKDAACWMQNYLHCNRVLLEDLTVENQANFNNDGIDIDGCVDVIVRRCHISSGDDALCFKGCSQTPTENILAEDCTFISSCNCVKIGTDTQGDFRNILVRRCALSGATEGMRHIKPLGADSGISLETVDGGTVERFLAENLTIKHSRSPFFIRTDLRGRVLPEQADPGPGKLRYVVLSHISGENNGPRGSYFPAYPGIPAEDIVLSDIHLNQNAARMLPPTQEEYGDLHLVYPDAHMLENVGSGDACAYGLWAKNVRRLTLDRYKVVVDEDEPRPEYLFSFS